MHWRIRSGSCQVVLVAFSAGKINGQPLGLGGVIHQLGFGCPYLNLHRLVHFHSLHYARLRLPLGIGLEFSYSFGWLRYEFGMRKSMERRRGTSTGSKRRRWNEYLRFRRRMMVVLTPIQHIFWKIVTVKIEYSIYQLPTPFYLPPASHFPSFLNYTSPFTFSVYILVFWCCVC